MMNFDDLPLSKKIELINSFAQKLGETMAPIAKQFAVLVQELSGIARGLGEVVFTDNFRQALLYEAKKERHRKRYYRMMRRRGSRNKSRR